MKQEEFDQLEQIDNSPSKDSEEGLAQEGIFGNAENPYDEGEEKTQEAEKVYESKTFGKMPSSSSAEKSHEKKGSLVFT